MTPLQIGLLIAAVVLFIAYMARRSSRSKRKPGR